MTTEDSLSICRSLKSIGPNPSACVVRQSFSQVALFSFAIIEHGNNTQRRTRRSLDLGFWNAGLHLVGRRRWGRSRRRQRTTPWPNSSPWPCRGAPILRVYWKNLKPNKPITKKKVSENDGLEFRGRTTRSK